MSQSFKGTVQDVVVGGRHGKYVVTTVDGIEGSVTFSLDSKVWAEGREPERGEQVCLSELTEKKGAGWRAGNARFWGILDELAANRYRETIIHPGWFGYLTVENADKVAEVMIQILGGHKFTYVTVNQHPMRDYANLERWLDQGLWPTPSIAVATGQELVRVEGGTGILVSQREYAGIGTHVHISVYHTDYSSGFSTALHDGEIPRHHHQPDLVYISFEYSKVTVQHTSPGGNQLHWTYAVEPELRG